MFNLREHSWCSIVEPLRNTLQNSRICTLEFGLFMASPKIIESPSQIKVCKMSKIERIFIRIPLSIFF